MASKWVITYNLLIHRVYWGYNPFTNHLLKFLGHPSELRRNASFSRGTMFVVRTTTWVDSKTFFFRDFYESM